MDKFTPSSDRSRSGTPANSRFTAQAGTAEDLLKEQTVGLVNLSDFRKRRAEALERKERASSGSRSGINSPQDDGAPTPQPSFKKKRKIAAKGKLSFGNDEDDDVDSAPSKTATPRSGTPADSSVVSSETEGVVPKKKRLGANAAISVKPRVMTKSALAREAEQADMARKDFVAMRAAVKATDVVIPFVFYDGTNIPGGRCRLKKGDKIWLFLDRARKVGAELGVGGDKSRREWARVSVDDLMLVRGELILPHHYDFYHFLFNRVTAFGASVFDYSAAPTKATPAAPDTDASEPVEYDPLARHDDTTGNEAKYPDEELEGYNDDPALTKVVDRRWYERNKHIFPASVWEEYAPDKDFSTTQRKDAEGNAFFFS